MTANEETRVAQMQGAYELNITELEQKLANRVPFEVLQEHCKHNIDGVSFDGKICTCQDDMCECTADNCPLTKEEATDETHD